MQNLNGKTILVTGATSGIGYFTALELAARGAQVVIGARTEARGQAAAARIRQSVVGAAVDYLIGDLSSMEQVRRLAASFLRRHSKLDVLVNNAAGFFPRRQVSVDGYEMTFALNHLSYFLLTNLLLDTLKASAPARVVNVASDAHRGARLPFDDLHRNRGYGIGMRAYGQSKLANVLFTYELDRRLEGEGITSNSLHPGYVRTGLATKHTVFLAWPIIWLSFLFGMSARDGAKTSVRVAADQELEGVSGQYFNNGRPVRSSALSYDLSTARRLWEVSEDLTGLA